MSGSASTTRMVSVEGTLSSRNLQSQHQMEHTTEAEIADQTSNFPFELACRVSATVEDMPFQSLCGRATSAFLHHLPTNVLPGGSQPPRKEQLRPSVETVCGSRRSNWLPDAGKKPSSSPAGMNTPQHAGKSGEHTLQDPTLTKPPTVFLEDVGELSGFVVTSPGPACEVPEKTDDEVCAGTLDVRTHRHSVLGLNGKPLTEAESPRQLSRALADALLGWLSMYLSGYLHRDISLGTVLMIDEPVEGKRFEIPKEFRDHLSSLQDRGKAEELEKLCDRVEELAASLGISNKPSAVVTSGDLAVSWRDYLDTDRRAAKTVNKFGVA